LSIFLNQFTFEFDYEVDNDNETVLRMVVDNES